MRDDANKISKTNLYLIMVGMLAFGTCDTVVQKYQDKTEVEVNGIKGEYHHPFVQTACMFFGQSMCLVVYFFRKWRAKNHPEDEKMPLSVL